MRLFDEKKVHALLLKWGDTFQGQDRVAREFLYDFIESEMLRYAAERMDYVVAMAGYPDPAEGCRLIIKEIKSLKEVHNG